MTRETNTVWKDNKGRDLLVKRGENEFYVPLSTCDKDTIQELALAAYDATKPEEPARQTP